MLTAMCRRRRLSYALKNEKDRGKPVRRYYLMAFCLALVNVVMIGCAPTMPPGHTTLTPLLDPPSSGVITAIDVDVLDDHTLVTLQANTPLHYAVKRDHTPPRLIIDLPGHVFAPEVKPVEVYRGGLTVIQPLKVPDRDGSQVEIGLQRPMSHLASLPMESILLVDLRPETNGAPDLTASEEGRPRRRSPLPLAGAQRPTPQERKGVLTLGRTASATAERATELIGVEVEPRPDRTRVQVFGNGPILLYKSVQQEDPPQLLLWFPHLETDLAGRGIFHPTYHLKHLAVLRPDKEGPALQMGLFPGVSPQIGREDSRVIVELTRAPHANGGRGQEVKMQVIPAAAQVSPLPSPPDQPPKPPETAPSGKSSAPPPVYTGQRISLDFQQIEIVDLLRLLSEVSGFNIITSPDVTARVTTRMVNVPWDQALEVILKTHGLGKEVEGTVIRVAPLERLRKERDEALQAKRTVEELEPPVTRTLQLNYARAEDLKLNLEKLLTKQGRLDIDKRTNTMIVKDVSATVDEMLDLIRQLDSPTRQVSIEARIVETSRTFLQQLGVRWGGLFDKDTSVKFPRRVQLSGRQSVGNALAATPVGGNFAVDLPLAGPAGAFGFSLISNSSILDIELQALERSGRGRIISNPKIVTLDNKEATIESGDEVPFKTVSQQGTQTQFKDAKITLKVTPHVSPNEFVLLEIEAAKKEPDFSRQVEGTPTITSRQSKTSILIKDGATAVIGGLFKGSTTDSREGVPGLSKVPVLGWLFKSESTEDRNEDLLFFITPRIVRETTGMRNR